MKRLASIFVALLCAAPALAQDPSGAWDVAGTDPVLGAYTGKVGVRAGASGAYEVSRLVEVTAPLPDGRTLTLAWTGAASVVNGALRVEFAIRRQDFMSQLGALQRAAADRTPLTMTADLGPFTSAAVGAAISGAFSSQAGAGAQETWTKTTGPAIDAPRLTRRLDATPVTVPRRIMMWLFRDYHRTPLIAPYAARPEFQNAVHFQMVDETGKAFTRANPTKLLVVQKVPDGIALIEEDLRWRAFRYTLAEKALGWDRAMISTHVEPATGMLGGVSPGPTRHVHGDSALHQGVWVASQMYRHDVTGDLEAIRNIELGTKAVVLMCDAPGRADEFGRAVMMGPPPNGWAASSVIPGLSYIPGGNNDMCHGVDYAFVAAERKLPAGHPLLADVGRCAKSLVEHHKVGQRGKHEIILSGVAARITGDSSVQRRYRRLVNWSPLELLWLSLGEGVHLTQEINGRSGPHLACTTFAKTRFMGGTSPNWMERLWRSASARGLRKAFEGSRTNRPGNLAAIAHWAGVQGTADTAKDAMAEVPYPAPTNGQLGATRIDWTIDPSFCASPYPALPWKFDYLTNTRGRMQALVCYPLWTIGDSDNIWKEGPYHGFEGGHSTVVWSRQDWLHAYWIGRAGGAVGPND